MIRTWCTEVRNNRSLGRRKDRSTLTGQITCLVAIVVVAIECHLSPDKVPRRVHGWKDQIGLQTVGLNVIEVAAINGALQTSAHSVKTATHLRFKGRVRTELARILNVVQCVDARR